MHGKIVGRGDIPDGHGYRWPPGDWFLAAIAVVFLRLVPKTRGVGGFCCMGRRGCHPDLRVGAKNRMVGVFWGMGRRGCHPDLQLRRTQGWDSEGGGGLGQGTVQGDDPHSMLGADGQVQGVVGAQSGVVLIDETCCSAKFAATYG